MNNSVIENKQDNYIFFSIGEYNYAFNSANVLSVMQLVELEYPEEMPDYMAGFLEYNNEIIKVIDLTKVLNKESSEYNLNSKIIVVKTKNDIFGIIADNIKEIRKIPISSFNATPYVSDDSYLEGIYADKTSSSTVINLESIEQKINSGALQFQKTEKKASLLLPSDVNSKETLHRRKMHYARKMREVKNIIIESQDTYITFLLGKNICCAKILHISGFYKYSNVRMIEIPCTPNFIKGVVNLKGRYITVIDLLRFTGDKETEINENTSIIVLEYEDYQIGIITGSIEETIDIDEHLLQETIKKSASCLNECVIKGAIHLFLDVKKLFADEKLYIS